MSKAAHLQHHTTRQLIRIPSTVRRLLSIMALLAAAGFSEIIAYNGYTFKPPTARSDRVFFVAEK